MRRAAAILSALGFLWGCAATVHLLVATSPVGLSRAATLAANGGAAVGMPPPLTTAEGVWMAGLLLGVTLLAGVPLGVALRNSVGQRRTAVVAGLVILAFCALAGFFIGLLYVPSGLLLLASGAVPEAEPRAVPYVDVRA